MKGNWELLSLVFLQESILTDSRKGCSVPLESYVS